MNEKFKALMNTLLFAFGTQKGGVAKSTLTTVQLNYIMHHKKNYTAAAVDADDRQRTIFSWRERDLEDPSKMNGIDPESLYEILPIHSHKFPDAYANNLNGNVDLMAVDLPGNIMQEGVMATYVPVDLLFIPLNLVDADITSTQKFLEDYKQVDDVRIKNGFPPADKYLLFSKIDRRVAEAKKLDEFRQESPLPVLANIFPHGPALYGRDSNTVLDYSVRDKSIIPLCEEIFGIIEKKYKEINE